MHPVQDVNKAGLCPSVRLLSSLGLLCFALTGCVGPLKQSGEEVSLFAKAADFEPRRLEGKRVAVLHAVVGFGLEGYSHQVSRSLAKALTDGTVAMIVIPPHEALSRINQEGLATAYAAMVSDYSRSGILTRDVLRQVGSAVNAHYALQPSMAAFTQTVSSRLSIFGLRLFQTRVTQLRLSVQIWDARTGQIVWEASGEATLGAEDVREFRLPFEEIAKHLWRRILQDLEQGPPPTVPEPASDS
jgi:hypothetical protein